MYRDILYIYIYIYMFCCVLLYFLYALGSSASQPPEHGSIWSRIDGGTLLLGVFKPCLGPTQTVRFYDIWTCL